MNTPNLSIMDGYTTTHIETYIETTGQASQGQALNNGLPTIGMSSSSRGGEWQLKWKEAGHWSQQMRSPPSAQASHTSWLWPLPKVEEAGGLNFTANLPFCLRISSVRLELLTWPLVVGVQLERVPGLLQVHVRLMPPGVSSRGREERAHL